MASSKEDFESAASVVRLVAGAAARLIVDVDDVPTPNEKPPAKVTGAEWVDDDPEPNEKRGVMVAELPCVFNAGKKGGGEVIPKMNGGLLVTAPAAEIGDGPDELLTLIAAATSGEASDPHDMHFSEVI